MMIAATVLELKPLDVFIGRWLTEGETIPQDDTPAEPIVASDVYQWAPGGRAPLSPEAARTFMEQIIFPTIVAARRDQIAVSKMSPRRGQNREDFGGCQ